MKTNLWKMTLPMVGFLAVAGAANAAEGQYCREFSQQIVVGGKVRQGYGTACMDGAGGWQIVSPAQAEDSDLVSQVQAVEVQPEPQVQYVVQEPVYYPAYQPEPFPVFLSFGYSNSWGHGGHGGWHGGHGGHGGHGNHR